MRGGSAMVARHGPSASVVRVCLYPRSTPLGTPLASRPLSTPGALAGASTWYPAEVPRSTSLPICGRGTLARGEGVQGQMR